MVISNKLLILVMTSIMSDMLLFKWNIAVMIIHFNLSDLDVWVSLRLSVDLSHLLENECLHQTMRYNGVKRKKNK